MARNSNLYPLPFVLSAGEKTTFDVSAGKRFRVNAATGAFKVRFDSDQSWIPVRAGTSFFFIDPFKKVTVWNDSANNSDLSGSILVGDTGAEENSPQRDEHTVLQGFSGTLGAGAFQAFDFQWPMSRQRRQITLTNLSATDDLNIYGLLFGIVGENMQFDTDPCDSVLSRSKWTMATSSPVLLKNDSAVAIDWQCSVIYYL